LFLLFCEIGTADVANGTLLSQLRKECEHFGGYETAGYSERIIDIEQTDGVLDGSISERWVDCCSGGHLDGGE